MQLKEAWEGGERREIPLVQANGLVHHVSLAGSLCIKGAVRCLRELSIPEAPLGIGLAGL